MFCAVPSQGFWDGHGTHFRLGAWDTAWRDGRRAIGSR